MQASLKTGNVQFQGGSVCREFVHNLRPLVPQETIMHVPVFALFSGAMRGLGSFESLGMHLLDREVLIEIADLSSLHVFPNELRQRLTCMNETEWALVVREFHDGHARAFAAHRRSPL